MIDEEYKCIVCGKTFGFEEMVEEFESLFEQVDSHGPESLTGCEQSVYEGHVCSYECYEKMCVDNGCAF